MIFMVFVAPNDSLVKAKIIQNVKTDLENCEQMAIKLEIIESQDIDELANFTKNKIGQIIDVIFPDVKETQLIKNSIINVKIQYVGDERGGKFIGIF